MIIKKLGQVIGLFASVAIIFSVFLSYFDVDVMGFSIFSMNLIQYSKKGAIILAAFGLLAFISSYACKGFTTGLLGIIIFVFNIFVCIKTSTGDAELEQAYKMVRSFLGDIIRPGIGFLVAAGGSLLLLLAGALIRKGSIIEGAKNEKKAKEAS